MTSLAPPSVLAYDDRLQLGQVVATTHRAAVARWRQKQPGGWFLAEGVARREPYPRLEHGPEPEREEFSFSLDGSGPGDWYSRPILGVNKTVVVWPERAHGLLVIGLVRRAIGTSYPATAGGYGYDGYDPGEPGSFDAKRWVWLYACKGRLDGLDYTLHPHWAVVPHPTPVL